ncbi:MAG TPA: hypothetical protein VG227_03915 [Caulobacteraceae bacterium]|nr:hypothetical protein [Caulobacteraceae bacterium]
MAGDDNLTGVWEGLFNWPIRRPPTSFTAVLIDTGGTLSGSVHEIVQGGPFNGHELNAMIVGVRSGGSVRFTKTYEASSTRFMPVVYDGSLNAGATEIDGNWKIKGGMSGPFLMMRSSRPSEAVETEERIAVPVE